MRLTREFYLSDAYTVGKALIGKVLCIKYDQKVFKYRIVETESYGGANDKACHAYNYKRTKRTEVMYKVGGHVYIYLIYGMYHMLNIVVNHEEVPEAVLIRAIEPLNMDAPYKKLPTNGPGKLCKHLKIDKSYYGMDLCQSNLLYIIDDGYHVSEITASKRINIDYAEEDKDRLWRFYIKDNIFVSKK